MEGLWDAAMAEANARLEERRAYLEREREAAGQLLNETQIRAEETARENEALRARQVVKDTTTAALRAEVVALRKEVAHLRRSEFWDHVIREIAEILPEKDWMSIEEIVRRLPPSLAKEALVLDKALTPGRVNRQMFLRDHHSRFFEKKKKEALYRKRPGWTSITSPTGKRRNASASAEATAGVDNA
jgi:type I site-specific restriction endonuclease